VKGKEEELKKFLAASEMVSFLQLAAEKKTPFLVQLEFFLPFYFVTALIGKI
jgi:hypothetical protein